MNQNTINAYQRNAILTASPAELTLMLYDGAIKFCNIAIAAIEQKEVETAHINIRKAQKIIEHLRVTLDMKYPVAKDFDNMYQYIDRRLLEANISKDPEILKEVLTHLHAIRDTWKEVMRINREKGVVC